MSSVPALSDTQSYVLGMWWGRGTFVGLAPLPGVTWCQSWYPLAVPAFAAALGADGQCAGWNLDTNNVGPQGTGTLRQPRPRPYEAYSEER